MRRQVIRRAENRCEYCHLAQAGQEAVFHIDHINPAIAGGATVSENLALACVSCSLRKGARREAIDPVSGRLTELFNPRLDHWAAHFRWNEVNLLGTTPKGRATVQALALNRRMILAIRLEEAARGRHG